MEDEKTFLKNYNKDKYEKPSVTADILVFTTDEKADYLRILLIKRKKHPFQNKWALPGGFVGISESLEVAARRELKEETGIETAYLEQLHAFGAVNRDPRMRVISVAYLSVIAWDIVSQPRSGDDASEAVWFNILNKQDQIQLMNTVTEEMITLDDLAFDHREIFMMAVKRIGSDKKYGQYLISEKNSEEKIKRLI